MTRSVRMWMRVGLFALLLAPATMLVSAERRSATNSQNAAAAQTVEMFAAVKSKDIEVVFLPQDSSEARVIIKNKTKKPLSVKLPDAFAGVPVLAQPMGGRGRPGAPGPGGMQGQAMGGGMGGMGGGMGGMGGGMGMGMMNIPAEKVAQFRVPTVCLEHGKREPRAGMRYEIKPIEEYTTKGEINELLTAFGKQRLNQRATQAAAWHLASGLSWEQLANKRRQELGGIDEPWFSPQEIQAAAEIAQYSMAQAQEKHQEPTGSPGQGASLNVSVGKAE